MEKEIISHTEPRKAWDGVPGFTTFDVPVTVRASFFSRTQYLFI